MRAALDGAARVASRRARGGDLAAHGAYRAAVLMSAQTFRVPIDKITVVPPPHERFTAPPEITRARRAALYLAVVAWDRSMRSVARAAGLTAEGVRKALAAVEDLRDDGEFDAVITQLERELVGS